MPSPSPTLRRWWLGGVVVVFLFLIVAVSFALTSLPSVWAWIIFSALMILLAFVISSGVTGSWRGLLIGEQNRFSLSRLQMVAWTLPILAAFLAAAIHNIRAGSEDPLTIAIPAAVWQLMGCITFISVSTYTGGTLC